MSDTPHTDAAAPGSLQGLLAAAERRWRLRRGLADVTVTLLALAGIVAVAAGVVSGARFAPEVVSTERMLVWALVLFAGASLAAALLTRRRGRRAIARYMEAREPALDGVLLTAVEADDRGHESGGLWTAVARDAVTRAARLDLVARIERDGLRRGATLLGLAVLAIVAGVLLAPPSWRHAVALLLPGGQSDAAPPWSLVVSPGDVTLVAGSDQRVTARLEGIPVRSAVLLRRGAGEPSWTPLLMNEPAAGVFEGFLFDVREPVEYRVDADGILSDSFDVDVLPRPRVERIDLTYRFPGDSGRAPERTPDGGPIDAVRGTRVTLEVAPEQPAAGGRLVMEDKRHVPLVEVDGVLRAELALEADGHYRVELDPGNGSLLAASPEYPIRARVDLPPVVEVRRPGRDTQATSIEELEIEVSARDDLAVRELELVLSVNGGPEQVLSLADTAAPELSAVEVLYLEDLPLEPGDLLSFHARAADGGSGGTRRISSDLYFVEVRPFDREFREGGGGGGGGGGAGGQPQQAGLAEQQREVVVALFNVQRNAAADDARRDERSALLEAAQARVRERVEAIVSRLGTRAVVEMNPGYRAMAEELPRASSAMLRVEALLAARDLGDALEPARQALRHLQRADAAFREVQVARQSAGAAGSGASEAGDLANLFALEMDRFRDQYSSVQRGRWNQPEARETDDIAEQLRQLAERQQREIERLDRRSRQGEPGTAGQSSQQALAEELERVTRELERLTRERPQSESLADALERSRAAAQAMRDADRSGDMEAGREAGRSLDEAGRALEGASGARLAGEVSAAQREAERLARAQRAVTDSVRLGVGEEQGRRLAERKQVMLEHLEQLRAEVDRLALESRDESPVAARELRGAAESLNARGLTEGMPRSRDRLVHNPAGVQAKDEAGMTDLLDAAAGHIAAAGTALTGGAGDSAGSDTDPVERLARLRGELEQMQRELEERAFGAGLPGKGMAGENSPGGEQGGELEQGGQGGDDGQDGQSGQASRGGDASGASPGAQAGGGAAQGGISPGAVTGGGIAQSGAWSGAPSGRAVGGGGIYGGVVAPFREALTGRARELDDIRRQLRADSHVARDIEAVVAGLLDLADEQLASAGHTAERHAALLARLAQVERALASGEGLDRRPDLLATEEGAAPPGWEALVDRYFRELASGEPGQQ